MSGQGQRPELPPVVEQIIARVLLEADLDFVDGREEVEAELRAHFEDGLGAGVPLPELIDRFGDPEVAGRRIASTRPQAASRQRRGRRNPWLSVSDWWAEVRRSARRLRRAPGFSAIVVLTLGLGVGANTAIFTVLNAVVLQDLPYAEPDRLVRVYESRVENPAALGFLRVPIFTEYRRWDEVFESLGAIYTYREIGADLTDGDVPRRVTVLRVSAGYFEALGVAPQVGRTFLEEESYGPGESLGSTDLIAAVAIISNGLWVGEFAGAPDIVGRTVRLDGKPFEVVGVLPAGYTSPFGPQGDVWIPQDMRMGGSNSFGNSYLSAVGRLRPGVSLSAAQERAEELSRGFGETQPEASYQVPRLVALQDDIVGPTRARMLWILSAAAALVLLTACVNVANLLFARGLSQDRSLALRSALGSGRARLVAGILTENGLLALLGGLAGVVMGWVGLRVLVSFGPDVLPVVSDLRMGRAVFSFALAITVAALMIFGLAPALRLSRTAPSDVLRAGDRSSTAGRAGRRVRDLLVVIQVASALILVAGAGLLMRSFSALTDVPLGVDAHEVLTFEVHLPDARYPDGASRHAFHERLHDRLRDLPGVEAVGATSWLPISGRYHEWGFSWDTQNVDGSSDAEWNSSDVRVVAGDYFSVMGIDVLRGREPADIDYAAEPVMWINERIVEEVFGEVDPLGRQVWMNGAARRVVGIVEDIPYGPRGETSRKLYLPHAQYNSDRNWALIQTVRARVDGSGLAESVRTELSQLDGQLVLYRPQSFEEILASVRSQDRFATVLMGTLAGLALLLSLLGTYGVLAGSVARRRREIGIRMALGADSGRVRLMILRYAAAITVPGVVLGVLGAWAASRWIGTLLYGVEPGDPVAYAAAVAVFLGVGLFSGWLPAERATRVDTVQVLSAE
jgi:putative ABC transport system permease protein